MPLRTSWLSLAVAAAWIGAAAPALAQDKIPSTAQAPRPPAEFKIGVVDLAQVFKQYRRSADLEVKINEERDRMKRALEDLKREIAEVHKKLDLLDPGSETYQALEDDKDTLVARWERMKKRLEETIKAKWESYNVSLLDDIEKIVRAYGEENRFSLILKVDGKSSDEARMLVGLKAVLYHSRELDITAPVVDLLNRNYELDRGKTTGGAPAGTGTTGATTVPAGAKPATPPTPPEKK